MPKGFEFCSVLQKDLNLVLHILVEQNDNDNAPFLTFEKETEKES